MKQVLSKYLIRLFIVFTVSSSTWANEESAWQMLIEGRAVAMMRHAYAPNGYTSSELTRAECEGQRNLSPSGREQARKIGDLLREHGVTSASVYSSVLCRCMDTGELLGFDAPVEFALVNTILGRNDGPEQTQALIQWIEEAISNIYESNAAKSNATESNIAESTATEDETQKSTILVTHGLNVQSLTNRFVSQGDMLILTVNKGRVEVLLALDTGAF